MKVTKRVLSILVSICMLMTMFTMTAFAEGTGSITIQNVSGSNASVAGKTLNLFKIFDATSDGTNIAYQWIEETDGTNLYKDFFFGATFKNPEGNEVTYSQRVEGSTIHDVVAYINELSRDSFAFSQMAASLHQYVHDKNITATKTSGTIEAGVTSYTFDSLDLGYYMIYDATELPDDTPAVRSAAMLAHSGENKVINLKADRPHIEKQVDDSDTNVPDWKTGTTASIGEEVTFRIVTMIPDHDLYGDSYVFEISDIMADGLVLDKEDIKVLITLPGQTEAVEMSSQEYKIVTEEDFTEIEIQNGVDFKITFIDVTQLEKDAIIEIVYDATVVNNEYLQSINVNTATLKYSNDPHKTGEDGTTGEVSSSANVLLWQFLLTKYMEDSSGVPSYVRLGGAEFEIYAKDNLDTPLKFNIVTVENGENDYYKYVLDSNGSFTTLSTHNTGDDGKTDIGYDTDGGHLGEILIWGLGEGTYVIRETKAPDGYQVAKGDFEFTVTDTVGPNGAIANAEVIHATRTETPGQFTRVMIREAAQKYYIGITNRPGSALPETGGIGATVYMAAGLALMVSAAAVLVYKKKNSTK